MPTVLGFAFSLMSLSDSSGDDIYSTMRDPSPTSAYTHRRRLSSNISLPGHLPPSPKTTIAHICPAFKPGNPNLNITLNSNPIHTSQNPNHNPNSKP